MFKEYLAHLVIDTPLEPTARFVRLLTLSLEQQKHPELKEIHLESARTEQLLEKIIGSSWNCIDVGCHLGSVLKIIRQAAPQGNHIAIEPIPYKANWLRKKFPDVEIMQIALSDKTEEQEFFLQPHRSGYSGLRLHNSDGKVEHLRVKCQRLDDIVPQDRPINFIKIDVEGGELAALRGAPRILENFHPPILFECTQTGLTAFDIKPEDIYEFLVKKNSYSVYLIKDWLTGGEPLSYEDFFQAMQYPFKAFNFLAA